MDIVIKSFNRAYLLDRVLFSIFKFVKNKNGKIIILDDGTPLKYLEKIQQKYPGIQVKKSPLYKQKVDGDTSALPPIQFWKEEIQDISENFLLLEDDIWLANNINLDYIDETMNKHDISLYKLCWWGNDLKNKGSFQNINPFTQIIKPRIPLLAEYMVKNRFYIHSLALLFHLRPKDYFTQLYTYYDVAGHIFNKTYYNYVWPNNQKTIQEMIQLGRAAEWFRKNKDKKIAKSNSEYAATTFLSSSTGNKDKLGFDMDKLNFCWNEAWYKDKLDSLFNFPHDFTLDYLAGFLDSVSCQHVDSWRQWSINWRKHFTDMGSDLNKYNNPYEWK